MERMNQLRAMDIMQNLWKIVRDNKCMLDELKEDFDLRRRPCCAIRKMANRCMERVNIAYSRFMKISEYYEFDDNYSIVPRTDRLFRDSVDLAVFFGV